MKPRLLYLSETGTTAADLGDGYRRALERAGSLTVVCVRDPLSPMERLRLFRSHEVYLVGRQSSALPPALARDPGSLRLVAAAVGSLRHIISLRHLHAGLQVTNWGDAPAFIIAEGALALLLTVLKDVRPQMRHIEAGGWKIDQSLHGGSLRGAQVGLYGCGFIGLEFVRLIKAFRPRSIAIFDPYLAGLPAGCRRSASLDELCRTSDILVLHAGLNAETRRSLSARRLGLLPDGAVVVNTARGALLDQDALFRELESGRLRAGLDVLEPDELPAVHPARHWPNLLLTAHQIGRSWPAAYRGPANGEAAGGLSKAQLYVVDNVRRFASGRSLRWLVDEERFKRMT